MPPVDKTIANEDAGPGSTSESFRTGPPSGAGKEITHVGKEMGRTRMQIHRRMRRFGVDPESSRS